MFNLKDVNEGFILMESVHGYGLCLFSFNDNTVSYEHGVELTNVFTNELEFHHFEYDDTTPSKCIVIDKIMVENLMEIMRLD